MATKQQLQKLDRYVDCIHELLQDQLNALRVSSDRQVLSNRTIFARVLGQLLYDAPKLHTGMVSVRLIETKLTDFTTKPTAEHHNGRQNGGEALLQLVDRALYMKHELDKEVVKQIALQYCQVHYTTSEENASLRRHQKYCSSEAAYRRANVVLIEAPDLFSHTGRMSSIWRQEMIDKYQPLVDEYNNPTYVDTSFTLTLQNIIN